MHKVLDPKIMIKAVFFDFYQTLGVWGESLRPRLQKVTDRYGCEIEWNRYDTARGNLYSDASGSDPVTHDLLETMQQIIESYRDFLAALGVRDYLDQMTWELLQSEHSLFAANAAVLYDDTVPTLAYLRDAGFKWRLFLIGIRRWTHSPNGWGLPTILIRLLLRMMNVSGPRSRIRASSTIHSRQSGFRQTKPCMLGIPTRRISSAQET